MKHVIMRHDDKIEIRMTGIGKDSDLFLQRFRNCSTVQNICKPGRYRTLDSIGALPIQDGVKIELKARPDLRLDLDEVEQCLDSSMERVLVAPEKPDQNC